jgi:threonine aldolase
MDGDRIVLTIEDAGVLRKEASQLTEQARMIRARTRILLSQREEDAHNLARTLQDTFERFRRPTL